MEFYILSLFPQMVLEGLHTSVIGRAADSGLISIQAVDIRDFTENKHKKVDDYPYGGGAGMLMQAQPVFDAFSSIAQKGRASRVIYVTPKGKTFTQKMAEEFAAEERLVFLCGHYEGIDERVLEEVVTDCVSIGDYVLTGGELPAMVMIDAIARLVPGVLHNGLSAETETFSNGLLEYPQYTRPEEWNGKKVPEILLSGDHRKISEWRLAQSVERTRQTRPDLYEKYKRLKECEAWLKKKKLHHMDMIELIRRGHAVLCDFTEGGALLQDKKSGAYLHTCTDRESGTRLLDCLPASREPVMFVTHQECMRDVVEEKYGLRQHNSCVQAVYTRGVRLPVRPDADIRQLDVSWTGLIRQHYKLVQDEAYIRRALADGVMYGIFEQGELAGFIGMHEEGSMGMLEVFPEYRGRGYAVQLESHAVNRFLQSGFTPYCQVFDDNEISIRLQKKLGLYVTQEKVCWFGKNK